jgi:peptide/nickel transport system permease protein
VLRLLFRRLVAAAPTLLLVTLGVSLLLSIAPGDPALTIAGGAGEPSREQVEAVREKFHLDDSPFVQYGRWASGAVVLDFGTAYTGSGPVRDQIWSRLPITAGLAFAAVAIALLLAVPLGTVAGARSGGMLDRLSRMISTLGVSIPNFCLAILLVVVVAVDRRWLPSGGFVRLTDDPVEWLRHTLLPAATLGFGLAGVLSRQLRGSLVDVLDSRFVQAAWARGCTRRTVVGKHGLKNAAIAPITVLGVQVGYLLGGTVIVEMIFGIPGLGPYMLKGITDRDLPVVQGVTFVFVLWQMAASFLVDVAYGLLSPKARLD